MQIVSLGDNLHKMPKLFSEKNISNCRLLKVLPSMLSVKIELVKMYFGHVCTAKTQTNPRIRAIIIIIIIIKPNVKCINPRTLRA